MLWYNVICHVFKVDIKICLNYFIKEIEFAIVYSLSIHYLEYCMMFVCNRKVTTLFWRLQQVNQFNWELPPSPLSKQAYSFQCIS